VCDDNFDDADAEVVCRQLGLSTSGAVSRGDGYYGQGYGMIWPVEVRCSGHESRLELCSLDGGSNDCTHNEDVGIKCSKLSNAACCPF
jgi:hypothetical protein